MQQITYPDKLNLVSVLGETISKMSTVQNLNNYYVSGTSGSDSTGNGMISNPWKTITKAINVLNAISGDITATINIAAGTYTETFPTITKSGISLIGASSLPNVTVLTGFIAFNMTTNSSSFSIGGFQNIQLNNYLAHYQGHGSKNSLNVSNCLFVPPNNKNAITTGLIGIGSVLPDMTVRDCIIYMSNFSAVYISNTIVSMYNTQLTNNPNLIEDTSFIEVHGSGQINLSGCSITQAFGGFDVDPLININNTATVNSSSNINNCMLVYTSAANQGTRKKCIDFSGTADMKTYTIINNYFRCEGQTDNFCIRVSSTPQLNLLIGQNIAAGTVKNVTGEYGNYTKTTLSPVS